MYVCLFVRMSVIVCVFPNYRKVFYLRNKSLFTVQALCKIKLQPLMRNGIFQAPEMDGWMGGWVEWAGLFLSEGYQLLGLSYLRKVNKKVGMAFIWYPNSFDNMAGGIFRGKDNIR